MKRKWIATVAHIALHGRKRMATEGAKGSKELEPFRLQRFPLLKADCNYAQCPVPVVGRHVCPSRGSPESYLRSRGNQVTFVPRHSNQDVDQERCAVGIVRRHEIQLGILEGGDEVEMTAESRSSLASRRGQPLALHSRIASWRTGQAGDW
jgi:hypothetical protein